MSRILVVPTNRPASFLEFVSAWEGRGGWDECWCIEDGPERSFDAPAGVARHYSWKQIRDTLGGESWIISRRDSAVRCFGLFMAWQAGADYALTLDDDTRPHYPPGGTKLFDGHLYFLNEHPRWRTTVPGLRVRGIPYENRGVRDDVAISVGLWSGVPDLDGKTQLEQGVPENFCPPPGARCLAVKEYSPLCGMNACYSRRAMPLAYYPLMGEGWPFSRFDDIASGICAKKVCDHLGWVVSVGEPFVRHDRASDPAVNAERERPGLAWNEHFWSLVDGADLTARGAAGCMAQLGQHVGSDQGEYREYHRHLGRAMQVWARLFEERPV